MLCVLVLKLLNEATIKSQLRLFYSLGLLFKAKFLQHDRLYAKQLTLSFLTRCCGGPFYIVVAVVAKVCSNRLIRNL